MQQKFPWGIYLGTLLPDVEKLALFLPTQKGGFTLMFDQESQEDAYTLVERVVLRLLERFPGGDLCVREINFGYVKRFLSFDAYEEAGCYRVSRTREEARKSFSALLDEIEERKRLFFEAGVHDMAAFHEKNPHMKMPYYLFLVDLDVFPENYCDYERIKTFFAQAWRYGVYTIAFGMENRLFKLDGDTGRLISQQFPQFSYENGRVSMTHLFFQEIGLPAARHFSLTPLHKTAVCDPICEYEETFISYDAYASALTENIAYLHEQQKQFETYLKPLAKWAKRCLPETASFPEDAISLLSLQELDMSECRCDDFPPSLGYLHQLKSVDFKMSEVKKLPLFLRGLCALESLVLYKNSIESLPEWIGELKALRRLDLGANRLHEVPETIGELQHLEGLYLSHNQLSELPQTLASLSRLRELYISDNQFTILPEFIGSLKSLRKLNISTNPLIKLPDFIGNLTELRELTINNNMLAVLPEFIGSLRKLKKLNISYNQIETLPPFMANLKELEELIIWGNPLKEVPEWIGELDSLEVLTIRWTNITKLPESIGNLQNLRKLDIGHNKLTTLPDSFGRLKNLKHLHLDQNHFLSLPDSLEKLVSLDEESFSALRNIVQSVEEMETQWREVKVLDEVESYKNYLEKYPHTPYRQSIIERIDTLIHTQHRVENEERVWQEAVRKNSLKAYENYLFHFPKGIYAQECRECIAQKQKGVRSLFSKIFAS